MNRSECLTHRSHHRGRLHAGEGRVGLGERGLHGGVVAELAHARLALLRLAVRVAPGQVELDPGVGVVGEDLLDQDVKVGDRLLSHSLRGLGGGHTLLLHSKM